MKPKLKISPKTKSLLSELSKEAKKRGASLYLVGGAVRDFALGRLTRDLDFTVEGDPTPLVDFCAKLIKAKPVPFDSFGTWRLIGGKDWDIDFATTRKEDYPSPASLPVVSKPAHILEDLKRRDFTINAMALRLGNAEFSDLIDPFNGLKDLENKVIETNPPRSNHSSLKSSGPRDCCQRWNRYKGFLFELVCESGSTDAPFEAALKARRCFRRRHKLNAPETAF